MVKLLVWLVGLGVLVAGVLYLAAFDVWVVPSDDPLLEASIVPTLQTGDIVLIARHGDVTRGNLARCPDPQSPARFVIARQIGEGRERIEIVHDTVSLDGKPAPSPHVCMETSTIVKDPTTHEDVTLHCAQEGLGEATYEVLSLSTSNTPETHETVEPGKIFLVSDNRHFHLDSRDYGPVGEGTCEHIVFRLWGSGGFLDPTGRFSIIW